MPGPSDHPFQPDSSSSQEKEEDTLKTVQWKLVRGKQRLPLREGTMTMGRGFDCDIIIDSPGSSRLHARLHATLEELIIEDAGSTNGVFVNGERIRLSRELADGDRILIGAVEFAVTTSPEPLPEELTEPGAALDDPFCTPHQAQSGEPTEPHPTEPPEPDVGDTAKHDALVTVGRVADRMLVMGRIDQAVLILREYMASLLDALHDREAVSEETIRAATHYALKLAAATESPQWLDYVIELHVALRRLTTPEVARVLQVRVSQGMRLDAHMLGRYKKIIQPLMTKGDEFDKMVGDMIMALGDKP
jgi:hypothetical protein